MNLNAFTCNFCGSICPVQCFPTHKDRFICHHTLCFAHAPSDPDRFNPLKQPCISTEPVSLFPTQVDVFGRAHNHDIHAASLPRQGATPKEHDEEGVTAVRNKIQERKILDLINTLRHAPHPTTLSYLFDASFLPSISEIVPGLFIGNMACVDNESVLKVYNINAVISIVSHRRLPFPKSRVPQGKSGLHPLEKRFSIRDRMVIAARDRRSENLIQHFEGACNFIYQHRHPVTSAAAAGSDTDARSDQEKVNLPSASSPAKKMAESPKGGRVLVHCTQGVSRSATIVAAYLMWRKRETAARVLTCIKNKRPKVNPNDGFLDQLLVWQDVRFDIWDSRRYRVPCNEYCELMGRLRRYRAQAKWEKAARRGL